MNEKSEGAKKWSLQFNETKMFTNQSQASVGICLKSTLLQNNFSIKFDQYLFRADGFNISAGSFPFIPTFKFSNSEILDC